MTVISLPHLLCVLCFWNLLGTMMIPHLAAKTLDLEEYHSPSQYMTIERRLGLEI